MKTPSCRMGSINYEEIQPLWDIISSVGNTIDLAEWMGQLPPKCLDLPLIYLAIPGSHNTMTHTIKPFAEPAPDVSYLYNKPIPICVRPWIRRWSRTQNITVTEQLQCGMRYLDLRICTKTDCDDLFYVHGLYGGEVKKELEEIAHFLHSHPKEVVIIDFQHFYSMGQEEHSKLLNYINEVFGDSVCPVPQHLEDVTLKYMYTYNYQVIIIYRCRVNMSKMWNSNYWPTYWPETMSTKSMIEVCENAIKNRSNRHGVISQCVLTATAKTLISPRGSVKNSCAEKALNPILVWLNHCFTDNLPVNIVIADYVQTENNLFTKAVISLNYRHQSRQPAQG